MPEQPPSAPAEELPRSDVARTAPPGEALLADEADEFGGVAADGGLAQVAAVGAVAGKRRGRGLSIGAWLAIGWMVFVVFIAVLAKTGILTWGDPYNSIASCARRGPHVPIIGDVSPKEGHASGFPLGCDSIGRDMEARLALGAWTSLLVATGAVAFGVAIGGALGLMAGYFSGQVSRPLAAGIGFFVGGVFGVIAGGVLGAVALGIDDTLAGVLGFLIGGVLGLVGGYVRGDVVDTLLTGLFNVLLSIPAVIMALALVAFLQGTASNEGGGGSVLSPELTLIIAIGVVSVPLLGRITRASALSWSQREFVLAARAQGAKNGRIMVREVLPNVLPAMFSIALLGIAVAIVAEGTLSILGVGIKPPTPSWGSIIALDRGELFTAPHIVFEASIMIFITVLALNYLGDVVRTRFDVREAGI